jgi:hypothetical protein
MDEDARHGEGVGHEAGVLAGGAAEAAQGIARDVMAALHGNMLDRIGHVADRDPDKTLGDLLGTAAVLDLCNQLLEFLFDDFAIQRLVAGGAVVICAGGGGIPVRCDPDGALHGVEAVIDKDRSAALLAALLDADLLLYLTDVPAVASDWGTAFTRPIGWVSIGDLRGLRFEEATMGPKVESACRFVHQTGSRAAIGAVPDAAALCAGTTGTQIVAYEFDPALVSGVPGGAAR